MTGQEYLRILATASKLKNTMRHCMTDTHRQESVAEHSWRLALMAMLLTGEEAFQGADIDKVIRMCLVHDLGEAFTGDIPTFLKTASDGKKEDAQFLDWVAGFPEPQRAQWRSLLAEMEAQETTEAKLYKALDKLEALISHNESGVDTWLPLEYDLQLTYGQENMRFSPWLVALRDEVDAWTRHLISDAAEAKADKA